MNSFGTAWAVAAALLLAADRAAAEDPRPLQLAQTESTVPAAEPAPEIPEANNVERVQRALTELGYDPGPVDGLMGAGTRNAIRAYQRDRDQEETGEITPELVAEMEAAVETNAVPSAEERATAEAAAAESETAAAATEGGIEITDDPASYDLGDLSDLNTFD